MITTKETDIPFLNTAMEKAKLLYLSWKMKVRKNTTKSGGKLRLLETTGLRGIKRVFIFSTKDQVVIISVDSKEG